MMPREAFILTLAIWSIAWFALGWLAGGLRWP